MARSDNWRINKSGIMAVEGAQILRSLQKVAGAAGLPKKFKVKFATKRQGSGINFDTKELVIGAGRLFNEAPIPADLFDVLVGLTIHEVGHEGIDTVQVLKLMESSSEYVHKSRLESNLFQVFCNVGEDIVIETRTRNNPNLAEYDEIMHKWATTQMKEAKPNKLMDVWIEYALGHKATTVMDLVPELADAMTQLVALTQYLRAKHHHSARDRFTAYQQYWNATKELILHPPKPPEPPQQQPDDSPAPQPQPQPQADDTENDEDKEDGIPDPEETTPDTDTPGTEDAEPEPDAQVEDEKDEEDGAVDVPSDGDDEQSSSEQDGAQGQDGSSTQDDDDDAMDRPLEPQDADNIDEDLADDIDEALETDQEDVTDEVQKEFGSTTIYPVIRSRETRTPLVRPDPTLRKQLERILTIRKRLQVRTMHGEKYGKIDKRHLHRFKTDERIFNLKYKFPDGFPNTRILIDLSSSMSGREAEEVLEAAGSLQSLVNAEVWCYYHHQGQVSLIRADEGKLIRKVKPEGSTPSGLAIVGVSIGMKKGGLVIHLTDGEHNMGQEPRSAHWILKKRGIDLVNLIWGRDIKHYDYDGISFKRLNGLADFPEALYQILMEQMNLRKVGGK